MSVPDRLQRALGDEEPIASTRLGGEDALVVTPTRSILYRAGGVLSEESIAEFAHDAERITVEEGRRKARITLEYGLEGEDSFSVPSRCLEDVLSSLLAVNLSATDVLERGETVQAVFFFDELTLVVTDAQVAKHVGGAVWDEEYEAIPFADVTGLSFESGRVNTQVVLETGTTAERIKTPQDRARAVREALQEALCRFHDVDSIDALEETLAAAAPEREDRDHVDAITLGEDFDLLDRERDTAAASATYESDSEDGDALAGLYDDRAGADGAAVSTAAGGDSEAPGSGTTAADSDRTGASESGASAGPSTASATRVREAAGSESAADGSSAGPAGATDATPADGSSSTVGTPGPDIDVETLATQVAELSAVLDEQTELIEAQRRTIDSLQAVLAEREE